MPIDAQEVDELTARALGITGAGALLVRPDGVPAMLRAGGPDSPDELQRTVSSLS